MTRSGQFFRRLFGRVGHEDQAGAPAVDIVRLMPRMPQRESKARQLPGFLASAIGRTQGERGEVMRARMALRSAFTPAQPVTDQAYFAGREQVLAKLIDVIEDQRGHVVIYGERGIGKTSLLHIFASVARESQYIVVYDSCGAHSRFDEVFRTILAQIPLLYLSSVSPTSAEAERGATLADRLPAGPFDARQLGDLCAQITGTRIIVILDEYDRLEDPAFRQSVAELIKNLSDRAARVQLVISGVASNLQELVGYIPSIRRNVVGLPMPRLTGDEVRQLVEIGERSGKVSFEPNALSAITILSNGSPYITRLLGHHASNAAFDDKRLRIGLDDIGVALEKIVVESETRVDRRTAEQARLLAASPDRALHAALARAASTPDGWFTAAEIQGQLRGAPMPDLSRVPGLNALLRAEGEGADRRHRFVDDSLPLYLSMMIARDQFREEKAGARAGA